MGFFLVIHEAYMNTCTKFQLYMHYVQSQNISSC